MFDIIASADLSDIECLIAFSPARIQSGDGPPSIKYLSISLTASSVRSGRNLSLSNNTDIIPDFFNLMIRF